MDNLPISSEAGLVRALGVRAMAANTVNSVVGAGIFALPAAVAGILGPSAIVAYLVCAVAIGLIAMTFAEAGSRVSTSGGPYAYAETAFGPFVGFLVGTLFWLGCEVVASAAVAAMLVGSLTQLLPAAGSPPVRAILLVALYGGLATVNIRGVRSGARLAEATTVAKLTPLAILVIAGLWVAKPANLAWAGIPPLGDVGSASLLLIFAFTGAEVALTPGGEVRDPARTVPRAVLLGMTVTTLLYISLQLTAQGVLGPELARQTAAPLAAAAGRAIGPAGVGLLLAGAAVSTFGWLSSDMLASPRLLFAFGRDGFLPARFARVHPRFRTPTTAIAVHAACCCAFALTGTFRPLAVLSVVAMLLIYAVCCLGVLRMRRLHIGDDAAPFRAPGGPTVPLLACGVALWLLASASRSELAAVAAMLAGGASLYGVRAWRRGRTGIAEMASPGPLASRPEPAPETAD